MKGISVIQEIYEEAAFVAESIKPHGEGYEKVTMEKECVENRLYNSFSKEQEQLFENFLEKYNEWRNFYEFEMFKYGVSLGIRITAESFLMKE